MLRFFDQKFISQIHAKCNLKINSNLFHTSIPCHASKTITTYYESGLPKKEQIFENGRCISEFIYRDCIVDSLESCCYLHNGIWTSDEFNGWGESYGEIKWPDEVEKDNKK
jgi:hypothetical protein